MAKYKTKLTEPQAGKLFCSIAYSEEIELEKAKKSLVIEFGKIEYESSVFDTTHYVSREGNFKQIVLLSFLRPIGREEITDIRLRTLALEADLEKKGGPVVEIDIGYVTDYTVVHTSLEEDFHRIYLYKGVFAESLYYFEKLRFRPWLHTPEFFRRPEIISVFNDLRLFHVSENS